MFDNLFTFKLNPWTCSGTVLDLIAVGVEKGEADFLTNLAEVDIVVNSNITLDIKKIEPVSLIGTEPLIKKIGEQLLATKCAEMNEVHDLRSTLNFLAGSAGFLRAGDIVKKLTNAELDIMIAWIHSITSLKFNSINYLNIAVEAHLDYKETSTLKMDMKDVMESYFLKHQTKSDLIKPNIIVVPAWYWVQQMKS